MFSESRYRTNQGRDFILDCELIFNIDMQGVVSVPLSPESPLYTGSFVIPAQIYMRIHQAFWLQLDEFIRFKNWIPLSFV